MSLAACRADVSRLFVDSVGHRWAYCVGHQAKRGYDKVTLEQVRSLLRAHHWVISVQVRRGQGKQFIYAKHKVSGRSITRYICAVSKLADMTEAQIVGKLVSK
jgi:hypothetical protein